MNLARQSCAALAAGAQISFVEPSFWLGGHLEQTSKPELPMTNFQWQIFDFRPRVTPQAFSGLKTSH
jgi:hypothetical protein